MGNSIDLGYKFGSFFSSLDFIYHFLVTRRNYIIRQKGERYISTVAVRLFRR